MTPTEYTPLWDSAVCWHAVYRDGGNWLSKVVCPSMRLKLPAIVDDCRRDPHHDECNDINASADVETSEQRASSAASSTQDDAARSAVASTAATASPAATGETVASTSTVAEAAVESPATATPVAKDIATSAAYAGTPAPADAVQTKPTTPQNEPDPETEATRVLESTSAATSSGAKADESSADKPARRRPATVTGAATRELRTRLGGRRRDRRG